MSAAREIGRATVTDDDGVLVIVDAASLRQLGAREPDFDFPGSLGVAVRDGVAIGWQSQHEGDVTIALQLAAEAPAGAHGPWSLEIADETVYLLPYSAFTMALMRQGEIERIEGLFGEVHIARGAYGVWVEPLDALAWRVTFVAGTPTESCVKDVIALD